MASTRGVADIDAAGVYFAMRKAVVLSRDCGKSLGANPLGDLCDTDPRGGSTLSAAIARARGDADQRRRAEYAGRDS